MDRSGLRVSTVERLLLDAAKTIGPRELERLLVEVIGRLRARSRLTE